MEITYFFFTILIFSFSIPRSLFGCTTPEIEAGVIESEHQKLIDELKFKHHDVLRKVKHDADLLKAFDDFIHDATMHQIQTEELHKIRLKKKWLENFKDMVTRFLALEKFENVYNIDVRIACDISPSNCSWWYSQRARSLRKMFWKEVFESQSDSFSLEELSDLISESGHFNDESEFVDAISLAYENLFDIVHGIAPLPGAGVEDLEFSISSDELWIRAVKLFMSMNRYYTEYSSPQTTAGVSGNDYQRITKELKFKHQDIHEKVKHDGVLLKAFNDFVFDAAKYQIQTEELQIIQSEMKWLEIFKNTVFRRSAIVKFENMFGSGAKIDSKNSLDIRKIRWNWIFENCQHSADVKELMDSISNSEYFNNVSEFAEEIAFAYEDLSDMICGIDPLPGTAVEDFELSKSPEPRWIRAMELFMSLKSFFKKG